MSWKLRIDQTREETLTSSAQVRARLLELSRESESAPTIVQLISPRKATLSIGLGYEMSVLNFVPTNGWPACTSVGDESAEGLLQYRVWDEVTELQAKHGVTLPDAVDAAVYYFNTEELSPSITWQHD